MTGVNKRNISDAELEVQYDYRSESGDETETEDENDYLDDPEQYAIFMLQSKFMCRGFVETTSGAPVGDLEEYYKSRIEYYNKNVSERLPYQNKSDVVAGRFIRYNICMSDLYKHLLEKLIDEKQKKHKRKRLALKRLEPYNNPPTK